MRCASVFIVRGFLAIRACNGFEEGDPEKRDPKSNDGAVIFKGCVSMEFW